MISKTRGIVIKYIKYRDTSIIVQIFTEDYGLVPFLINGIRSPRSKRSISYFQPFSLLELVAYIKSGREVQRLSEFKFFAPTHQLHQDIRKSAVTLFLAEILSKLLMHEPGEKHQPLFEFLSMSIQGLDQLDQQIENFHLHFLLKLMPHMGIGVEDGSLLIQAMESELGVRDPLLIQLISSILANPINAPIKSTGKVRSGALELVLEYIQHHTFHFGEINSLKVLQQVFN